MTKKIHEHDISTIEVSFKLPVMVRKTAAEGGYMVMFPKNRLHIQGFARNEKEAVRNLGERLKEVILGERNIL